ncbi:MAG TPA: hypothetical protein VGL80_16590 [Pseudonocardiaceae bacterium]
MQRKLLDDLSTVRGEPQSAAPQAYASFQHKRDGMVKVLLQPEAA